MVLSVDRVIKSVESEWKSAGVLQIIENNREAAAAIRSVREGIHADCTRILRAVYTALQSPDGDLLVLQRSNRTSRPGTWEFPGGKVDGNPTDPFSVEQSRIREFEEETGIKIPAMDFSIGIDTDSLDNETRKQRKPKLVATRRAEEIFQGRRVLYLADIYRQTTTKRPEVELSDEHQSYKWLTAKDVNSLKWTNDFYKKTALSLAKPHTRRTPLHIPHFPAITRSTFTSQLEAAGV
ncbi:NUDIX domain-containing protein [Patescibacteria group bacterium]|nr:NUDIX domain-containing protein [Patescibacteria group bacterium]